jgi:hypothetical protein
MKTPIIKQSIYPDGTSIAIGEYIGRDEALHSIEWTESTEKMQRRIQAMKISGYEFQHVRIVEVAK